MEFRLPFFTKPDPPPTARDDGALGAAVQEMVSAKMAMLHATLRARCAFLKATAAASDSKVVKDDLNSRAAEIDFLLGQEILK